MVRPALVIKKCIGCSSDTEDESGIPSLATICGNCVIPRENVPAEFLKPRSCPNCRGKTNLVGVFHRENFVMAYFDCPNPVCAQKRITLVSIGTIRG